MSQSVNGTLWKAKYGLTGSIYWKRKFCYADAEKFVHWQTEIRPDNNNTPPRHGFLLYRTTITEDPKLRACSFKFVDKLDNRTMIFAAENVVELEKWMRILNLPHPDPAVKIEKPPEEDNQSVISLFENAIEDPIGQSDQGVENAIDYIINFFERNDFRVCAFLGRNSTVLM